MPKYLKIKQPGGFIFIPGMRCETRTPVIIDITHNNEASVRVTLAERGIRDYEITASLDKPKKINSKPKDKIIAGTKPETDNRITDRLDGIEFLLKELIKQSKDGGNVVFYEKENIVKTKKIEEDEMRFIPDVNIEDLTSRSEDKKSSESVSLDFLEIAKMLKGFKKED